MIKIIISKKYYLYRKSLMYHITYKLSSDMYKHLVFILNILKKYTCSLALLFFTAVFKQSLRFKHDR